ncbi:MAG: hypothetical protein JKY99_10925 [Rhizobiales bacterium]|nr:hypothetical protein [Hyphomicrobiales bacterium]
MRDAIDRVLSCNWAPALAVVLAAFMVLSQIQLSMAQLTPLPRSKPGSGAATSNFGTNLLNSLPQILGAPPVNLGADPERQQPAAAPAGPADARLVAKLVEDGDPIPFGVVWRVYGQKPDSSGTYPLIATGRGGAWTQTLDAGSYLVHAAYGKATATALLRLAGKNVQETVILSAGGLRLQAQLTGDISIPAGKVSFRITEQDSETTDEVLVVKAARPGLILPLNAGTYRVRSQYGNANAAVSADITVEEGKLTDATLYHRAAEITLKLVNEPGGEAIANTAWTVLYPNGEVIAETVGAFPEYMLEEGDYSVVATHEGTPHNRNFSVEAGRHKDVEVLISGQ